MSEVIALQPAAIVDHVALLNDDSISTFVGAAELGGSRRVDTTELKALLSSVPGDVHELVTGQQAQLLLTEHTLLMLSLLIEFNTKAGGSAANVARSLAGAFGVAAGLVGACGDDEWGDLFLNSLRRAGVATDRVRCLPGPTGRAVILTSRTSGQRTMRTNLVSTHSLTSDMLEDKDFLGSQWLFLSAYTLYQPGLLRAAATKARAHGTMVMLDLASWEMLRAYAEELQGVLQDGLISCCIGNEDEAKELLGRPDNWSPEHTIEYLLQHCSYAVVTLGAKGCAAGCRADSIVRTGSSASGLLARTVSLTESTLSADGTPLDGALVLRQAAVSGVEVVDTTGAGDAFSSGFLYGLLRGLPLEKCASIGCMAGAAAVQTVGADMGPPEWHWLHQRLHSGLAAAVIDNTPQEIFKELLDAYALISRIGVGVVYFGSARLNQSSQFYQPVVDLARDVALLLRCPTWTGGGPGIMRAASEGAMQAGLPVGAVKISREAGQQSVRTADYLPQGTSVVCKHMPTRKAALTDAGVRRQEQQRTAYVFLPGGLGTMDELFAILTLIQLNKLDTQYPVPLVVVNYDGFFDGLLQMLSALNSSGVMKQSEVDGLYVAKCNSDVLCHLGSFYGLDASSIVASGNGHPQ